MTDSGTFRPPRLAPRTIWQGGLLAGLMGLSLCVPTVAVAQWGDGYADPRRGYYESPPAAAARCPGRRGLRAPAALRPATGAPAPILLALGGSPPNRRRRRLRLSSVPTAAAPVSVATARPTANARRPVSASGRREPLNLRRPSRRRPTQACRSRSSAIRSPTTSPRDSTTPSRTMPTSPSWIARRAIAASCARTWSTGPRRPRITSSQSEGPLRLVMMGANDRQPIRDGETTVDPMTDRWKELYRARVEAMVKPFTDHKIPLIWVGLPPMQSQSMTRDLAALNDLVRGDRHQGRRHLCRYLAGLRG